MIDCRIFLVSCQLPTTHPFRHLHCNPSALFELWSNNINLREPVLEKNTRNFIRDYITEFFWIIWWHMKIHRIYACLCAQQMTHPCLINTSRFSQTCLWLHFMWRKKCQRKCHQRSLPNYMHFDLIYFDFSIFHRFSHFSYYFPHRMQCMVLAVHGLFVFTCNLNVFDFTSHRQ